MSTLEYLATLTPQGVNTDTTAGYKKHHQWQDVAGALGMGNLSQEAYLLARAKYCHEISASEKLQKVMTQKSTQLIARRQWKSKRNLAPILARVACFEVLSHQRCRVCFGTGVLYGKVCEFCDGIGRERVPEAHKYELANIDKRNWQRRWRERYEEVYQLLIAAEDELEAHLRSQL